MIHTVTTATTTHMIHGAPPVAARAHKYGTVCGRSLHGRVAEATADAVTCGTCKNSVFYSSALATGDREAKAAEYRARQAALAAPEQIRSRRELANTIAQQAEALAAGAVTGSEFGAVLLLQGNVAMLRAWTPDDRS